MRSATGEAPPVVLVADDDEDVLQLVAAVLEEEGYEIETTDWKRSTVYRLGAPTSPCWTSGCPVWTASS